MVCPLSILLIYHDMVLSVEVVLWTQCWVGVFHMTYCCALGNGYGTITYYLKAHCSLKERLNITDVTHCSKYATKSSSRDCIVITKEMEKCLETNNKEHQS